MGLPQSYRLLRLVLVKKHKTVWEIFLVIARFLDKLEEDHLLAFPDDKPLEWESYEKALRKLFDEKYKS